MKLVKRTSFVTDTKSSTRLVATISAVRKDVSLTRNAPSVSNIGTRSLQALGKDLLRLRPMKFGMSKATILQRRDLLIAGSASNASVTATMFDITKSAVPKRAVVAVSDLQLQKMRVTNTCVFLDTVERRLRRETNTYAIPKMLRAARFVAKTASIFVIHYHFGEAQGAVRHGANNVPTRATEIVLIDGIDTVGPTAIVLIDGVDTLIQYPHFAFRLESLRRLGGKYDVVM